MSTSPPSEFDENVSALMRETVALSGDYGIRRFILGISGTLIFVAFADFVL